VTKDGKFFSRFARLRVVDCVDVPSSSFSPRQQPEMLIRTLRLFSLPAYEIVCVDIKKNLLFLLILFFLIHFFAIE
jgi:hypothetical protein